MQFEADGFLLLLDNVSYHLIERCLWSALEPLFRSPDAFRWCAAFARCAGRDVAAKKSGRDGILCWEVFAGSLLRAAGVHGPAEGDQAAAHEREDHGADGALRGAGRCAFRPTS